MTDLPLRCACLSRRRDPRPRRAEMAAARTCCALPYRIRAGHLEVLLVTTSSGRWILPKGRIDAAEAPFETAAREAWEEGGVRGTIDMLPIGGFDHVGGGRMEHVLVYPLDVREEAETWPEQGKRRRCWATAHTISDLVEPDLARLVEDFAADADAMIGNA